jgi:hypothetical protein
LSTVSAYVLVFFQIRKLTDEKKEGNPGFAGFLAADKRMQNTLYEIAFAGLIPEFNSKLKRQEDSKASQGSGRERASAVLFVPC